MTALEVSSRQAISLENRQFYIINSHKLGTKPELAYIMPIEWYKVPEGTYLIMTPQHEHPCHPVRTKAQVEDALTRDTDGPTGSNLLSDNSRKYWEKVVLHAVNMNYSLGSVK